MTDLTHLVGDASARPRIADRSHLRGYDQARDTERHAAAHHSRQPTQLRTALDRLSRVLDGQVPVRDDVPPGYYLNILV